ncbi:MAG TPA: XRE family transcriptional regulator [Acholeplasmatales bacterium]|nr:XRE family transcriptional regulator [Acholeplasmatales bacterium]
MISSIGTRIKELRKIKNISQEELANELSVSRQTISKWESDIVSPDINNIEMLSNFFEVSTDYIINGKENKTSPKQNNVWIILCFIIGIIAIIGTSISMIINKGKNSPLSTINFSYEFVLMIIGSLMVFLAVFYFFKRKK